MTQTRQILRKLLVGRLVCQPFDEAGRRGYRFTGTVTYERLLPAGQVVTLRRNPEPENCAPSAGETTSRPYVVTPAGFEPAFTVRHALS